MQTIKKVIDADVGSNKKNYKKRMQGSQWSHKRHAKRRKGENSRYIKTRVRKPGRRGKRK